MFILIKLVGKLSYFPLTRDATIYQNCKNSICCLCLILTCVEPHNSSTEASYQDPVSVYDYIRPVRGTLNFCNGSVVA